MTEEVKGPDLVDARQALKQAPGAGRNESAAPVLEQQDIQTAA